MKRPARSIWCPIERLRTLIRLHIEVVLSEEDREITVRYGTAEEFESQGVRKEVDRKGVLRAIEITALKKDLQVRSRRGYYAPRQ